MTRKRAITRMMDATLQAGVKIPNVSGWCRVNGVDRRTFYRHRARIQAEGRWQRRSRQPKHRPQATPEPVVAEALRLAYARPRDCCQIDAQEITLAGGNKVVVFEVRDDCTRLLVAAHAAPGETAQAAIEAITASRGEYGAPGIMLCNNGSAVTSDRRHPQAGPSQFARVPAIRKPAARSNDTTRASNTGWNTHPISPPPSRN
jgi:hypothetical protein